MQIICSENATNITRKKHLQSNINDKKGNTIGRISKNKFVIYANQGLKPDLSDIKSGNFLKHNRHNRIPSNFSEGQDVTFSETSNKKLANVDKANFKSPPSGDLWGFLGRLGGAS